MIWISCKRFLLFAVIAPLGLGIYAQKSAEYFPRYFNKQNKQLSENIISDLLLDETDRLWIATPNGLFQFDGSQITPYPSRIPERIAKIFRNSQKELFINCVDKKTYKITEDTFILQQDFSTSDFPPFHNSIFSINKNFGNTLLPLIRDSIKNAEAFNLFADKKVYVRRKGNIYSFRENKFELKYTGKNIAKDIFYQNKYWIVDADNGILKCINQSGINSVPLPVNKLELASSRWFTENNSTPLLIYQNKAWILAQQTKTKQYYWKIITDEIPNDIAIFSAIYSKKLDKLIIGTFANGLIVYSKSNFSLYQHSLPKSSFNFYNYYLQIPLKNGQFIGDYPNQSTNTPQYFRDFFKNNNLSSSYHYLNKATILGSTENYYYTLDLNTLKPKKVGQKIRPMGQNQSYTSFKGKTYIINTYGVFTYSPEKDTIIPKLYTPIGYGLINQSIVIDNKIWLAYCGGLLIYDPETNSIKHIKSQTCFRYFFRFKKQIIVTTYGEGLYLIDTLKLNLKKLKFDHYGSLKRTHFLLQDKHNFIWASTNDGVLRFPPSSLEKIIAGGDFIPQPQYFDFTDGLPTDEMNGGAYPAYLNIGDSLLSIPSLVGIIQFRPLKDFPLRKTGQRIIIKNITGLGKSLFIKENKLLLSHNINEIKFNLQTIHWGNPKSLNLYYRIDDTLIYIPYNELTRLDVLVEDPGIHTLEFLYIDDLGIEKTVLTLQIEKEKPWYLQSLFIISFIILMMIITGFISRMRIRNTERKNIKLREIIKEKTKEITDINEQLMTKVAELTQLNKINGIYISVINHDIFAPIKYINVVGDKVYEYQKRLKKEDIVNHLQLIINSTKRLEILCSNILNERSSGNSFTSVQPNISLHNMIADLQGFVKIGLQINNNELTAKIPIKAVASTSQSALNIILTNLISNANRFTKNGTISIKYSFKEQLHRIEIKDTGNGMQPDVLKKIQNRTLQVNHKDSSDLQSYGIGYSLIFKMLDIIKADMKVSSAPLKGTTVTIIFPDLPVQEISKISAS